MKHLLRLTETLPQVRWQRVKLKTVYWHKNKYSQAVYSFYPCLSCLLMCKYLQTESAGDLENLCVTDREDRLKNLYKSSQRLLMSLLTAGSSEVIKSSNGGVKRTNRGGARHHLLPPVSFIFASALMKSAYLDWRTHDVWYSRAWHFPSLSISQSE